LAGAENEKYLLVLRGSVFVLDSKLIMHIVLATLSCGGIVVIVVC
jgi:hypothetical protein